MPAPLPRKLPPACWKDYFPCGRPGRDEEEKSQKSASKCGQNVSLSPVPASRGSPH